MPLILYNMTVGEFRKALKSKTLHEKESLKTAFEMFEHQTERRMKIFEDTIQNLASRNDKGQHDDRIRDGNVHVHDSQRAINLIRLKLEIIKQSLTEVAAAQAEKSIEGDLGEAPEKRTCAT